MDARQCPCISPARRPSAAQEVHDLRRRQQGAARPHEHRATCDVTSVRTSTRRPAADSPIRSSVPASREASASAGGAPTVGDRTPRRAAGTGAPSGRRHQSARNGTALSNVKPMPCAMFARHCQAALQTRTSSTASAQSRTRNRTDNFWLARLFLRDRRRWHRERVARQTVDAFEARFERMSVGSYYILT